MLDLCAIAQVLPVERTELVARLNPAITPLGCDDGGIGDGIKHTRIAEIDDGKQVRILLHPEAQVFAVFGKIQMYLILPRHYAKI